MSPWRPQGGPAARSLSRRLAFRPQLQPLEERAVPATVTLTDPLPTPSQPVADKQMYAVGADIGNPPMVQVYNADGSLRYSFMAYAQNYLGGVRVAVGDVTGDGVPDIVTAPGPGISGQIKVFDGTSGAEIANFMAYNENFKGGVYVAVADVNDDGHADIITGAGPGGGPHVRVFDGKWVVPPIHNDVATPTPAPALPASGFPIGVLTEFYAYNPTFSGGVRVAAADTNGDGHADIITGAGPGGGPHVKVYDGATGQVLYQFFAFASTYTGGVYVTGGDIVGDGKAEVVVGSGIGLGQVKVYDDDGTPLRTLTVDDHAALVEGVHVAMADVDGDGKQDLLLSVGTSVEARDPLTNATIETIAPFDPTVLGGVFVG